ncbi:low affinity iron permease family protein [Burkholderia lata]|uniref:low affinity iron permease family protein n=1 Tax=Burkholderia lata (strain ATCC 17760 / DSM 23089 / LMG 22485 / NCIMB 9086 / R18194 / 383) TaxID=482957 RepID=UPI0020C66A40|nr:low affinity iron permease family protein [Burkholderia lata]
MEADHGVALIASEKEVWRGPDDRACKLRARRKCPCTGAAARAIACAKIDILLREAPKREANHPSRARSVVHDRISADSWTVTVRDPVTVTFERFASHVTVWVGSPTAFGSAVALTVRWIVTGPPLTAGTAILAGCDTVAGGRSALFHGRPGDHA